MERILPLYLLRYGANIDILTMSKVLKEWIFGSETSIIFKEDSERPIRLSQESVGLTKHVYTTINLRGQVAGEYIHLFERIEEHTFHDDCRMVQRCVEEWLATPPFGCLIHASAIVVGIADGLDAHIVTGPTMGRRQPATDCWRTPSSCFCTIAYSLVILQSCLLIRRAKLLSAQQGRQGCRQGSDLRLGAVLSTRDRWTDWSPEQKVRRLRLIPKDARFVIPRGRDEGMWIRHAMSVPVTGQRIGTCEAAPAARTHYR